MSIKSDKIKDYLYEYRRSIEKDLSEDQKKIVDAYIEKTSESMVHVLDIIENISKNDEVLASIKKEADKFMKDEKWLEKLLRTSSQQ